MSRVDLHYVFSNILSDLDYKANVYYQPPEGTKLEYPCVIYNRDKIETKYAGNKPYIHRDRYSVTVIDRDPESDIVDSIMELPMCSYDRHFVSDGLHHDTFTIYY